MDKKSRLTARADTGMLYAVSRQILEEVQAQPSTAEDRWPENATLKNRLLWISNLFFKTSETTVARRQPWLGPVALGTLFVVAVGIFLGETIRYHSIYNERMERMKERIEIIKQEKEKQQQEQNNGRE